RELVEQLLRLVETATPRMEVNEGAAERRPSWIGGCELVHLGFDVRDVCSEIAQHVSKESVHRNREVGFGAFAEREDLRNELVGLREPAGRECPGRPCGL